MNKVLRTWSQTLMSRHSSLVKILKIFRVGNQGRNSTKSTKSSYQKPEG